MRLSPELLLRAYAAGVFPMAEGRQDTEIHWVDPKHRAIFPMPGAVGSGGLSSDGPATDLDAPGFHVSRSLARHIRRTRPRVTVDHDFAAVVTACANRPETWINAEIFAAYGALHAQGHAHSLEVWQGDTMIGGVYGVVLGAAFFGESMFSTRVNGSKIALTYLMHRLAAGGFTLFDVQFLTAHLQSLGAVEVPRAAYRRKLGQALGQTASFAPQSYPPEPAVDFVLSGAGAKASGGTSQRSTQTS